jgi:hypothetical protein
MRLNWRLGAALLATMLTASLAVPAPAAARQAMASTIEQMRVAAAEVPRPRPFIWSADADAAGKCVDVWNWGSGPWIQMWPCHGGPNQQWFFADHLNGIVEVFTNYNGIYYCIDGWAGRGRQLMQYVCDDSSDQRFKRTFTSWGSFRLESVRHRGQCMDVYDWGRGNAVQLWDCHGGDNQHWWY